MDPNFIDLLPKPWDVIDKKRELMDQHLDNLEALRVGNDFDKDFPDYHVLGKKAKKEHNKAVTRTKEFNPKAEITVELVQEGDRRESRKPPEDAIENAVKWIRISIALSWAFWLVLIGVIILVIGILC